MCVTRVDTYNVLFIQICAIYSELDHLKCGINVDCALKCYLTLIQSQTVHQSARCLLILRAQYRLLLLISSKVKVKVKVLP